MARKTQTPATRVSIGDRFPELRLTAITGETWRHAIGNAAAHRRAPLPLAPTNGNLGLPADLLITADGSVAAVKYGAHAYDQWSVDELLDLASGFGRGTET
jgi:hypothetical protein